MPQNVPASPQPRRRLQSRCRGRGCFPRTQLGFKAPSGSLGILIGNFSLGNASCPVHVEICLTPLTVVLMSNLLKQMFRFISFVLFIVSFLFILLEVTCFCFLSPVVTRTVSLLSRETDAIPEEGPGGRGRKRVNEMGADLVTVRPRGKHERVC